ncbi:MAG: hypothetical protein QNI92_03230 [Desulfobacterales bacterium]|nr:hypothetical protein [Desulfobacterales bacterium]MDJ0912935.1 hypothetical protein [Desulfobacterales bacterium]
MSIPTENLYTSGHLLVAAVRVLTHRQTTPPTIEEICQLIDYSSEHTHYICRKLSDIGALEIVDSPVGLRLFLKNHLCLEDLPKQQADNKLDEELKKFQESKHKITSKVSTLQADEQQRKKDLFAELENKLKKGLDQNK